MGDDGTGLIERITRLEWIVAGIVAVVLAVLVLLEPDILGAPFENTGTIVFTVGGTVVAGIALVLMLRFDIAPVARIVVLLVPFAIVNWWLLSPFFVDEVVDEDFATSIAAELDGRGATDSTTASGTPADTEDPGAPADGGAAGSGPELIGSGTFVGLAGHSGTGDAGLFRDADGSYLLRFENFDIQNGPDLVVYLVPGADQTSLADGAIDLGALKGNVGNQTYELPAGTDLAPGDYTALVWCDAFSVEFVGATVTLS